ncbi:MAG: putative hemolysin [Candidatus Paceibacteria bacterium]|jgi:putative hemolysin
MEDLYIYIGIAALLLCSASFSGFEAALFSLSPERHEQAPARVQGLLMKPRELLIMVLLGNLFVNITYFSICMRLDWGDSAYSGLIGVLVPLVMILVFGEILPKTLALRAAPAVSRLGAVPAEAMIALTRPLTRGFSWSLDIISRAMGESGGDERAIDADDLAQVLSVSAKSGLLERSEADMLVEIIELGGIRVREIMTPRVDALLLDIHVDPEPIMEEAARRRHTWLPVYDEDPDHILGCVRMRDLYLRGSRKVAELVMPVKFVPEVADALDLLRSFREDRATEAVVVDEWGGTAGVVTIEDVFEEIVGELRVEGEEIERPVVPLGEGRFRVLGRLSIRDWNDEFGFRVVPNEFETVGGFVTALLGRIPKAGDEARVGRLVFEVREVRGRRVVSVDMHVEAMEEAS